MIRFQLRPGRNAPVWRRAKRSLAPVAGRPRRSRVSEASHAPPGSRRARALRPRATRALVCSGTRSPQGEGDRPLSGCIRTRPAGGDLAYRVETARHGGYCRGVALDELDRPENAFVLRKRLPMTGPVGLSGSRGAAREGAAAGAPGERRELEARLQQTQRLEAVGLLAAGVAHDFNNLLTAIRGYAQIALESAGADDGLRESLDEILLASERAADVTRQLLAFSRRQTLRPRTFDLNQAVLESRGFLPGSLAAQIRVATALAPGVCGLFADPGQVEQVLINLAVSARDRMAGGGTLTIETGRTELGAVDAVQQGIDPGPYVVLRITDTGEGMDAERVAHAFNPFFTTKPVPADSELRLASVYGIARQR